MHVNDFMFLRNQLGLLDLKRLHTTSRVYSVVNR